MRLTSNDLRSMIDTFDFVIQPKKKLTTFSKEYNYDLPTASGLEVETFTSEGVEDEYTFSNRDSATLTSSLVLAIQSIEKVLVRITMGVNRRFTGYIRQDFSQNISRFAREFAVTVEDMSFLLDDNIAESFQYPELIDSPPYTIFNPSNTARSIIHILLAMAGYGLDDISATEVIADTVLHVSHTITDERSYRDFIDTLLYEHGYVQFFDRDGKWNYKKVDISYISPEYTVKDQMQSNSFNYSGNDSSKDGVKLEWSTPEKVEDARLYMESLPMKEGIFTGQEILAGEYFPPTGDIEEIWQEFTESFLDRPYIKLDARLKNKDITLIATDTVVPDIVMSSGISQVGTAIIDPKRAKFLFQNTGETTQKLFRFDIIGNALIRSQVNTIVSPATAKTPMEYTTEFIFDNTKATRLANNLSRFTRFSKIQYSWSELDDREAGLVVRINPTFELDSYAIITEVERVFYNGTVGSSRISAIGIRAYEELAMKTTISISTAQKAIGASQGIDLSDAAANENILTPFEKRTLKVTYDSWTSEKAVFIASADERNISRVAYEDAYDAVEAYVDSVDMFVDMSVNTNIEGTVWDGLKGDYLTERAYLRGYISDFDASELTLYTSSNVINVSARDALLTDYIEFEVQTTIIPTTSITWKAYNGGSEISGVLIDLVTPTEGKKRLDCSALPYLTIKSLTVEATIAYGGKTYRDVQAVAIAKSTLITAVNFGGVKLVPTTTPDGESLATGDYFLWADDSVATHADFDYETGKDAIVKGCIYEYGQNSPTKWEISTNTNLVMSLFDDFANLADDVDSQVIGNAVIKKLVTLEAVVKNLVAQNVTVKKPTDAIPSILSFNGSNSSVVIPYASALQPTAELRIEVSAYMDSWEYVPPEKDRLLSCTEYGGYMLAISDGFVRFTVSIDGSYVSVYLDYTSLADGWHDFECTYDGQYIKLYVDNNLEDTYDHTTTAVITYGDSMPLVIGAEASIPYPKGVKDSFFNGRIKNLKIYSKEDGSVLVGSWGMQEGTGATIYDSVSTNNGTIYNAQWITEDVSGFQFLALTEDTNGRPRFGVYFDGRPIFVVQPDVGKIYFGEHFWYDPIDGAIHTPNDKMVIGANGILQATDVDIDGKVETNELLVAVDYYSAGDTLFYGSDFGVDGNRECNFHTLTLEALSTGSVRVKATVKAYYYSVSAYGYPTITIKKNDTTIYTSGRITDTSNWTSISQDVSYDTGDLIELLIVVEEDYYGGDCYQKGLEGFCYDKSFSNNDIIALFQKDRCQG